MSTEGEVWRAEREVSAETREVDQTLRRRRAANPTAPMPMSIMA